MKVISMRLCPYVQQVRAVLEAKKVRYDVEHIEAENRPQWLLEASPDGGEVPLLINDGGEALFQSDAIVEYLDEVLGDPLLMGDPLSRAKDKAWGRLASDNYLVQCSTQRSPDEATLRERLEDLTPIFKYTELNLQQGPYFHGVDLSMVDLSWLPLLHRTGLIAKYAGYDFLTAYPKLKDWRNALSDTGPEEGSVPENFDAIFTDFYLSEETYLGRLNN
ncbi:MAG: glutathione S-transferase family protein [Candidatus Latescibacteria bacterium]|nr:glutathione S-transferase family protein [Candidatus Latescibacterota bacterium]